MLIEPASKVFTPPTVVIRTRSNVAESGLYPPPEKAPEASVLPPATLAVHVLVAASCNAQVIIPLNNTDADQEPEMGNPAVEENPVAPEVMTAAPATYPVFSIPPESPN